MIPLIVLIEDDKDIQIYLSELLTKNNFVVQAADSGINGLALIEKTNPNLVLLDLTLPDMTGEGVCTEIRKQDKNLPIIILTAKDSVSDKVRALTMGADDYITKPFVSDELLARVKARLRSHVNMKPILQVGDLTIDTQKFEVKRGDKVISLTPQEFKLLEYLMRNTGVVLTREMILNRIWAYSPDIESRVVDVYMGYLRKKIDNGNKKKLLYSIRGFGYTIKE